MQRVSCLDHSRMISTKTKDTQSDIIQCRAKYSRNAFNMDTPSTILCIRTIQQVTDKLKTHWFRYRCLCDIMHDDQTRDQEPSNGYHVNHVVVDMYIYNLTLDHRIHHPNGHPRFEVDDKTRIHYVLLRGAFWLVATWVHSISK